MQVNKHSNFTLGYEEEAIRDLTQLKDRVHVVVAVLAHVAHNIHDKLVQSGSTRILPKQGSTPDHIKHQSDVVVLIALDLSSNLLFEIGILFEESVEG